MLKIELLQLINKNETAKNILQLLAKSRIISDTTNLPSFLSHLTKLGLPVIKNDFIKFFEDLKEAGVGDFTTYRNSEPIVFKSRYSLKNISEQALYPNKLVDIKPINEEGEVEMNVDTAKRGRGRPPGTKNKEKVSVIDVGSLSKQEAPKADLNASNEGLAKRRGRPKGSVNHTKKDIMIPLEDLSGEVHLFSLSQIEMITAKVQKYKNKLQF